MESARRLYGKLSRTEQPQSEPRPRWSPMDCPRSLTRWRSWRTRLNDLESDLTRQAELASRMAAQEEALSQGLQAVSGRAPRPFGSPAARRCWRRSRLSLRCCDKRTGSGFGGQGLCASITKRLFVSTIPSSLRRPRSRANSASRSCARSKPGMVHEPTVSMYTMSPSVE